METNSPQLLGMIQNLLYLMIFEQKKARTAIVQAFFVGVAGFEPAASCSQSRRDNRATLHPELQL